MKSRRFARQTESARVMRFVLLACAVLISPVAASAQTIANVKLTAGAATFGLAVPQGVATSGLQIGSLPTQTDVKNKWPDGSIRFAILSAVVPSAATYAVTPGAASSGSMSPTWPSASVRFVGSGANLSGTYVATLPAATSADPWLSGPVVRENRVVVAPVGPAGAHPYLRVIFDVRSYSNGVSRVDVTAQNAMHERGGTLPYDVTIVINNSTVFTKTGFNHFYQARWRKHFAVGGTESAVTPDFTPFINAKALPRYMSSITNRVYDPNDSTHAPFFVIGQRGGLSTDGMDAAGARSEIAPYPDWVATYIVHKDETTKRYMLETDDLAGSWPIHLTDEQGRMIRTDRAPGTPDYWMDNRGANHPLGTYDSAQNLKPDNAHCPSLGYTSYLVTGDRYYADELKFWANFHFLSPWPADWWYPRVDRPDVPTAFTQLMLAGEIRGVAWGLRNMADAATYVPDSDPDRSYLWEIVRQNLERMDYEAAQGGTYWHGQGPEPFDFVWSGKGQNSSPAPPQPAGAYPWWLVYNQWQAAMTAWTVDHVIDQGLWGARGAGYRARTVRGITRLFNSEAEGFGRWQTNGNYIAVGYFDYHFPGDRSVVWASNMGDISRLTIAHADDRHLGMAGGHGLEMYTGLNIAEGLGVAGSTAGLTWMFANDSIDNTGEADLLNTRAGWAIQRGSAGASGPRDANAPKAPTNVRLIK